MHPFVEQILERPTSHKVGGWIGIILFLTFVFWQYFYSGLSEELTKLNEEIESLEGKILTERRIARNLDKVREEVKELDVKLKFAMQELPDKKEIPDLLSTISDLATDAGLEITLFKPRPEQHRDFYAEVPVSISVDGSYHQVATFFDEVGQLPRIVNINQIALRNPKVEDTGVMVKADCSATTFRYLEESERVQKKKKKKGRRR